RRRKPGWTRWGTSRAVVATRTSGAVCFRGVSWRRVPRGPPLPFSGRSNFAEFLPSTLCRRNMDGVAKSAPIQPIDPRHPQPRHIDRAVGVLQHGGIVSYPTDTYYAL